MGARPSDLPALQKLLAQLVTQQVQAALALLQALAAQRLLRALVALLPLALPHLAALSRRAWAVGPRVQGRAIIASECTFRYWLCQS